MKRAIYALFAILAIAAISLPLWAEKKANRWLLIALTLQPLQTLAVIEANDEADCWAKGTAFLGWATKGGLVAGITCQEIIPGAKPEGFIKDKDGNPAQLKKERDS